MGDRTPRSASTARPDKARREGSPNLFADGFDQQRQAVESRVLNALRSGHLDEAEAILDAAAVPDTSLRDMFLLHHAEREAQTAQLLQMRQHTEQTLAWFAGLYQALPMAALLIDQQGLITSANDVGLDDLGLRRPLSVMPVPLRRLMATAEGELEVERAIRDLAGAQTCRLHDLSLALPGKSPRWADLSFTRLPAAESNLSPFGGQARYICVVHDRTERVAMRNSQLAAEQAQHERDLAQHAARAKSELISRISHEFRTPLNAIMGFSELLLFKPGRLDTEAAAQVRHIFSAGSHLLKLVDSILRINRAEAGKMEPEVGSQDLRSLVQEVTGLMTPMALHQQVTLDLDGVAPTVRVDAHRPLLREVLENLISNAIKYNRAQGWVRIGAHAADGRVQIDVADGGLGMTPEQLAHLYEPFNRLGAEKLKITGTGLGLCLAHDSVKAMKGHMDVRSVPGEGTCFTVDLPGADGQPAPAAQAA